MKKNVSIILACYNDELSVEESTKRIIDILDTTKYQYEIILIDDASLDGSRKAINKIKNKYPTKNIKAIFHEKNVGRGGTVKEGLLKAKGDIAGFLDIDLEVSENYLPAFILAIDNGADLAIGSRVYKIQFNALHRYFGSLIYPMLVRKLLKLPFKDTEAGYKFFNRKKVLDLIKETKDNGWFWDTEIIARAYSNGQKIIGLPVLFVRRPEKKSSVKFFHDSFLQLQKLMNFKKEMVKHN